MSIAAHNSAGLNLIQVSIDVTRATRHFAQFMTPMLLQDDSLLLKTALTEAFGGPAIRPWAIHAIRGPTAIIVGYSMLSALDLDRRRALALPSLQVAVGEVLGIALPSFSAGERYRFKVRLAPTIRVTPCAGKRHGERDAFLAEVDRNGDRAMPTRDEVYRGYLGARLAGAALDGCRLDGFQLLRIARPKQSAGFGWKTVPEAVMQGGLTVTDPAALVQSAAVGVGRQRAYGFGMLRFQPAQVEPVGSDWAATEAQGE
jgi:hypothetical protein